MLKYRYWSDQKHVRSKSAVKFPKAEDFSGIWFSLKAQILSLAAHAFTCLAWHDRFTSLIVKEMSASLPNQNPRRFSIFYGKLSC